MFANDYARNIDSRSLPTVKGEEYVSLIIGGEFQNSQLRLKSMSFAAAS
jgi:hypothetical protein